MMLLYRTAVALVIVATAVGAQPATRPDFPESVASLPAGVMQFELGSTYGWQPGMRSISTGETVLRAGLSDRVELQLSPASVLTQVSPSERSSGLQDSGLALKFWLTQFPTSPSLAPALALNVGVQLPTGHAEFRSHHALPRAKLLASWNIGSRLNFTGDAGWSRGEAGGFLIDAWSSTANLGFTLTGRTSLYSEYINGGTSVADWGRGAFVTGGIAHLLAPSIQLDLRAGHRADAAHPGTFYHLGLARTF
jgi:hypothetical protein